MLVVRLELWPGGSKEDAREIGRMRIANISDLAPISDYHVHVEDDDGAKTNVGFRVAEHPRRECAWSLVRKAIERWLVIRGEARR